MRDFKGMKRQRRNRNGGGGKPQHNSNRAFDSNGPDSMKVRGAAQHVYEKYQQLARDAHTAGDRVTAENFLQHAEHYFRVMRAMQPQRPVSDIIGRDQFVSGYDIDFEDESAQTQPQEPEADGQEGAREDFRGGPRDDRQREDRSRDDRPRDDRPREDRSAGERFQGERRPERFSNERQDRGGGDRNGQDRFQRGYRDERPRYRDERPRNGNRELERGSASPQEPAEPRSQNAEGAEGSRLLRADDGEVNSAPAFLQVRPIEPRDEETRRPRRRRPEPGLAAAEPEAPKSDED